METPTTALAENRILLPLGEDVAGGEGHDLLLEFFSGAGESEAGLRAGGGTNREPTRGRASRPCLFLRRRIDLSGRDSLQVAALEEFRKRHMTATVDSYGNEKEFRAKFSKQLGAVGRHARAFPARRRPGCGAGPEDARPAPHGAADALGPDHPDGGLRRFRGLHRPHHAGRALAHPGQRQAARRTPGTPPRSRRGECAFDQLLSGGFHPRRRLQRPALPDFIPGFRFPQDPGQDAGRLHRRARGM
ncbi:MAG: hypothetical protein WDO13_08800 [Verrucomicrobiota bacterium]